MEKEQLISEIMALNPDAKIRSNASIGALEEQLALEQSKLTTIKTEIETETEVETETEAEAEAEPEPEPELPTVPAFERTILPKVKIVTPYMCIHCGRFYPSIEEKQSCSH